MLFTSTVSHPLLLLITVDDQPQASDEVQMENNPAYAISPPVIVEADPAYESVQAHGHQGTLKGIPSPYETTVQPLEPAEVQISTNPAYVKQTAEEIMEDDPTYKGRTKRKDKVSGDMNYSTLDN